MHNPAAIKRVYLASALSNATLNCKIADSLLTLGLDCYLPQEDPVNSVNPMNGDAIASKNRKEIENCDFLIAVFHKMGIDTSWEIGYATGLKKVCFLVCSETDIEEAQLSAMPFFSIDQIIMVPEWSSSEETFAHEIGKAIKSNG